MKKERTMADKIRIGMIGIGSMGTGHCRTILEGKAEHAELTAVCDIREERRTYAKENFPENIAAYEDYRRMIADKVCDAVMIEVPHYFHPEISAYALTHGMHVLCEKPLGVYEKQLLKLKTVAEESDRVFAVMFNQRTDYRYRKIHELVAGWTLGELKRVTWKITDWYRTQYYYDSGSWRGTWDGEGGGVLMNQCPHQLDLLQWICGMPDKVYSIAHEGKWHDIEVEDDVTAYMEFPNGATGVFISSTGDAPGANRLEIDLTKGKILCDNGEVSCFVQEDERTFVNTCQATMDKPEGHWLELQMDGKNPQHAGVIEGFARHILYGEPLVAEGLEGIRGVQLANAMYLSAWTGQMVQVPADPEVFYQALQEKRRNAPRQFDVHESEY